MTPKYGMMFRVSTGAALSVIDGVSDCYVIYTYYRLGLTLQADSMLAMISAGLFVQLLSVLGIYKKKGWDVKLREVLITLLFLRPAIDAFRVSTNYEDAETTVPRINEMMINKVRRANRRGRPRRSKISRYEQ